MNDELPAALSAPATPPPAPPAPSRSDSGFYVAYAPEIADKERRESETVRRYLPAQMSEAEVAAAAAAAEIIRELGVTPKKEMGRVMMALMSRHPGRVGGRLANQIVASHLA